MMRIVGGAIGPVVTILILTSATISITVNNVPTNYPSPVTFNILFGVGVAMSMSNLFLATRLKHLAAKMKPLTAEGMA